ncbi:MAG: DUF4097 family beta strand repeat-containing protein [bacterium]
MNTITAAKSHALALAAGAFFVASPLVCACAFAQSPAVRAVTGDEVAIYNLVGDANVVAGDGPSVEVSIAFAGADAHDLTIEEGSIDGRATLRVVYPGSKFVYASMGPRSRTELRVNDDGTFPEKLNRGRKVTISGDGPGVDARADLTIRVPRGKRVRVYQAVGEVTARDIEADLLIDTAAAPAFVEAVRGAVSIDVGSGSVQALRIDGALDIDTGSGEVNIQEVRGVAIRIDTGSGEVTGSQLTAPDIEVSTGSGEVELTDIEAKHCNLDTGSGSVSVEMSSDVESMAIDTGSGSVEIVVPSTLGADLYVETGSGEVRVGVPHTDTHRSEDSFRCRIGDGRGEIRIDSGSGDVSIIDA